jgi:hypothetical protein
LVEECIEKREFWAMTVLLQNGEWRLLFNLNCGLQTSNQALRKGLNFKIE